MPDPLTTVLAEQATSLLAALALLAVSAAVGAAETALFSLTKYEKLQLRQGPSALGHLADRLLATPQILLLTILLTNLAVNIALFTVTSLVAYRFAQSHHPLAAAGTGLATLLAAVLFAEILPKAVAYHLRTILAKLVAPPLYLLSRILRPILLIIRTIIVDPAVRILTGAVSEEHLQENELLELLQTFAHENVIQNDQIDLIRNVVDLRSLRVRQIMTPRVDLVSADINDDVAALTQDIRDKHSPIVAVYRDKPDHIVGIARTRRVGLETPRKIADILEPAYFVPEQQRLDQLIQFFQDKNTNAAIVVDEYGGPAGAVRMANIVEELLGHLAPPEPLDREPKLQQVRPSQYTTDAAYDLDPFCRRFDVPKPDLPVETLGGLILALVGHLPEPGDHVEYHHLMIEVDSVVGSKITRVSITDRRGPS